jgi:ABC-type multidrug transport system fused ATPase/permease subunit
MILLVLFFLFSALDNDRYVGQEPVLFAGTIADNILYGLDPSLRGSQLCSSRKGSITASGGAGEDIQQIAVVDEQHVKHNYQELMARVYQAAKLANAHDFIQEFPQGYDTDVGSNGTAMRFVT